MHNRAKDYNSHNANVNSNHRIDGYEKNNYLYQIQNKILNNVSYDFLKGKKVLS